MVLQVLRSGIPNFCAVALALHDLGYVSHLTPGDVLGIMINSRCINLINLMFVTMDLFIQLLHVSMAPGGFGVSEQFLRLVRYKALGIRLDSGDLSYFSIETRKFFHLVEKEFHVVGFGKLTIVASNDINEATLDALNKQVNICSSQPLVLCCKFLLGVEMLKSKLSVQSSIHISWYGEDLFLIDLGPLRHCVDKHAMVSHLF